MALFTQKKDLVPLVETLREQGLTDSLIMEELTQQGNKPEEIHMAISQVDSTSGMGDQGVQSAPQEYSTSGFSQGFDRAPAQLSSEGGNIYERIEEITERLVDEKWDDLIAEVKKIIEWKESVEAAQRRLMNDVAKLKEDFKTLHSGVLGKLESYDSRMQDVGTELSAVGKVFKDVIPEFVENVKELKHVTGGMKKK